MSQVAAAASETLEMRGEGLISGAAELPFSVPRIAAALPHTGRSRVPSRLRLLEPPLHGGREGRGWINQGTQGRLRSANELPREWSP